MARLPHGEETLEEEFDFINAELPPDSEYKGTYKSASESILASWYYLLVFYRRHVKSQARELTRMQRRNLKLQQKITQLTKNRKGKSYLSTLEVRRENPLIFVYGEEMKLWFLLDKEGGRVPYFKSYFFFVTKSECTEFAERLDLPCEFVRGKKKT